MRRRHSFTSARVKSKSAIMLGGKVGLVWTSFVGFWLFQCCWRAAAEADMHMLQLYCVFNCPFILSSFGSLLGNALGLAAKKSFVVN